MPTDDRPVSWWFKQEGALTAGTAVSALTATQPPLPPVGLLAVSGDTLTATFVDHAQRSTPSPWKPLGSRAATIALAELPKAEPEPGSDHQPLLVAFGSGKHGLVVLNLGIIDKIRLRGDADSAGKLATRWILELLATHPETTVAATDDLWHGPWTGRLLRTAGCVSADVLFVGPKTSYAERMEINQRCSRRRALIDLGVDSALDTIWTVECEEGGRARLLRGGNQLNDVTIPHTPQTSTDQWPKLLSDSVSSKPEPEPAVSVGAVEAEPAVFEVGQDETSVVAEPVPTADDDSVSSNPEPEPAVSVGAVEAEPAVFEVGQDETSVVAEPVPAADDEEATLPAPEADDEEATLPAPEADDEEATLPAPEADDEEVEAEQGQIWNRILGHGGLSPLGGGEPHPREKQLEEITCFLQTRRSGVTGDDLRAAIWGKETSQNTLLSRVSDLRKRLGTASDGQPALPQQDKTDGKYRLHPQVRSDWEKFDSLVDPIPAHTPTPRLDAALQLVNGPLFGGSPQKPWADDLRDRVLDRIGDAALVLSERLRAEDDLDGAMGAARKGLLINNQRQDLWRAALESALAGEDPETIRDYQEECRQAIPTDQREPGTARLLRRRPGERFSMNLSSRQGGD